MPYFAKAHFIWNSVKAEKKVAEADDEFQFADALETDCINEEQAAEETLAESKKELTQAKKELKGSIRCQNKLT